MKKSIFALLIVFILVLGYGCTSDKANTEVSNQEVSLSVTYGYDKFVKYGRYMSIHADISNQGKEFEGTFQVIIPTDDRSNIMYEKVTKVKSDENTEVSISVPINTSFQTIEFRVKDKQDTILASKRSKMNIIGGIDKVLIGVLTDDYESMNYLSNDSTKVFYLSNKDIPVETLGYDTLDALVINNYDTNMLSSEQYEALKGFVNNGGSLIIGTGENADRTLAKFTDRFISVATGDYVNVDDLMNCNHRKSVRSLQVDESDVIASHKEIPFIWKVEKGKGNIQIIGLDMGLPTNEWNTIGTELLSVLTNHFSKAMIERMQYEYRGYYNYGIFNSIGIADDSNLPNVLLYIAIIIIYMIVIGPPLYVILKKRDKRSYIWLIVPAFSISFALLLFAIGAKTRMTKPYVRYLSVVNVEENMSAKDKTYFSLTAPYNTNYTISVNNKYHISNLTNQNNYYMMEQEEDLDLTKYKTGIRYKDNNTDITLRNYAAFQTIMFETDNTINIEGTYSSELNYSNFKLDGTFTNQLGIDLTNAVLFSNSTIVNLGNIEDQQTIEVKDKEQETIPSRDLFSTGEMIKHIAGGSAYDWRVDSDTARRFYALDYYITTHFSQENNTSYIIGFDHTKPKEGVIKELGLKNDGVRMIIIPVKVNTTKDGKTIIPSMNNYMSIVSGEYDSVYNIIMTNQLKVDYTFEKTDKIISLLYSKEYNTEFVKDYWSGFYGTISAFNYNTGEYDRIFTGGIEGELTQLSSYINDDNTLSLLFEVNKTAQKKYSIVLPTISAVKEAK